MQRLCSISAHLWANSDFLPLGGSPRMQGLCSISAHLWAKSDFVPLCLGCYALKQKYHLPCPPPRVVIFFCSYICTSSDQRDEATISRHVFRGLEPPRPL